MSSWKLNNENARIFDSTSPQAGINYCALYCGDYKEVLKTVRFEWDCIITDPPYSEKTHAGHNKGTTSYDGCDRQKISYDSWNPKDVQRFVKTFAGTPSWILVMTDHTMAPTWRRELEKLDRYVFAPVVYYAPFSRVRMNGDGPSNWSTWIIPSRTTNQCRWGALPGGYYDPEGKYGKRFHIGGKPPGLITALVKDYSKPDQTVLDPCMGAGTSALGALRAGRRFIGIEKDPETFKKAVCLVDKELRQPNLF